MSIVRVGMTIDQMAEKVSDLESANAGLVDDLRKAEGRASASEAALQEANGMIRYYQRNFTQTGW